MYWFQFPETIGCSFFLSLLPHKILKHLKYYSPTIILQPEHLSFAILCSMLPQNLLVLKTYYVVATCTVRNLVVLPVNNDFTFTVASPFIMLYIQKHVKPILKNVITSWHVLLILPCCNRGTTLMMNILVLPVLLIQV
jgi:hypothetical protein